MSLSLTHLIVRHEVEERSRQGSSRPSAQAAVSVVIVGRFGCTCVRLLWHSMDINTIDGENSMREFRLDFMASKNTHFIVVRFSKSLANNLSDIFRETPSAVSFKHSYIFDYYLTCCCFCFCWFRPKTMAMMIMMIISQI